MPQQILSFTCAGATNTFYVPVPKECKLKKASWVSNTDPSTNKSVAISKNGGSDIITGNISATPGAVVEGTMTATVANENQVLTPAAGLKIIIIATAALQLGMILDFDEFLSTDPE